MKVLGKWRNAISVTEDQNTGEIKVHRFDKKADDGRGRWKQIAYFSAQEDFDDFIDFLDEISEDKVEAKPAA